METKIYIQNKNRQGWNYCDKCMFFDCCKRVERRQREGCDVYEEYPWELPLLTKIRLEKNKCLK